MKSAKKRLRAELRAARRQLSQERRRAESAAAALCCAGLLGAGDVASYAAMADEVDLAGLHLQRWSAGRSVLLPRVVGDGLLAWHVVTAADQLISGSFGIMEPDPLRILAVELPQGATILVPGIAFSRDGHRLGQGGGFYDRLLASRPDLRAIGVGFSCQLVVELPREGHDRVLDGLVIAGEVVLPPSPT